MTENNIQIIKWNKVNNTVTILISITFTSSDFISKILKLLTFCTSEGHSAVEALNTNITSLIVNNKMIINDYMEVINLRKIDPDCLSTSNTLTTYTLFII